MGFVICRVNLHQLISKNLMPNKNPDNWLQYSGIGIQMAATIIICWWFGEKLVETVKFIDSPWWQLLGLFFGMFAGIYNLIKQVR